MVAHKAKTRLRLRMLRKVLVYAYLSNIHPSRRIEAAVRENIQFLWVAGMRRPDHRTIDRYRGQRLKNNIREVFTQVVLLLMEAGHVDLKAVYTEGTKLEANANKYTFVMGQVHRHQQKEDEGSIGRTVGLGPRGGR